MAEFVRSGSRRRGGRGAVAAVVAALASSLCLASPTSAAPDVRQGPVATSVFAVNDLADAVDLRPGDGACATARGTCTLRAAVQEANTSLVGNTVLLPAGRIGLAIAPRWPFPSQTLDLEVSAANGDLDIVGVLTVKGQGAHRTTIDAQGLDRILNVTPGSNLTLEEMTLTGGDATRNNKTPMDISDGGAVLNAGTLSLAGVAVVHNRADGGGGVFSIPFTSVTIQRSLIAGNAAVEGGGLRIDGAARIDNSTISGNWLFERTFPFPVPDEMTGYGGGIDHRGTGNVVIANSTIVGNRAVKAGGGYNSGQNYLPVAALTNLWPYRTYLSNTVVYGNTAQGAPSDCHVSAMVIRSRGHNLDGDGSCARGGPGDRPRTDPGLGPLAANGGPTATHAPLAGSAVVDAGSAVDCPPVDQRGQSRPSGRSCDIGAVELAPQLPARGRVTVNVVP